MIFIWRFIKHLGEMISSPPLHYCIWNYRFWRLLYAVYTTII